MFDYNSIPAAYYDKIYRRRRGMQSMWHHMKFEKFLEFPTSTRRHLDLACGSGTYLGTLEDNLSIQHIGIDIAPQQIKYANGLYGSSNRTFLQSSVDALPFKANSFDVITSIELIEHLSFSNVGLLLKEVLRVLRPGGSLLLSTPNYKSGWVFLESLLNILGQIDYRKQHISRYNRALLEKTLASSGFLQIQVESFMFLAPFTAFLGWHIPHFLARYEPNFLVTKFGFLLFAKAKKPS